MARTAPYIHDGSLKTLEEVVDYYDRGGNANPNLDEDLRPLHLTAVEESALVEFHPSPPPPYIGAGTLGITALSENHFVASEAGEGEIARTTPEEDLSAFGHVGSCFLDGAVELHLVYHIDQQTHGFLPGPINTWVVNARFFFP